MVQIKIFGLRSSLATKKDALSLAIHNAVVEAFAYPVEKKFHRYFLLDQEDFIYPSDRSDHYTIIEISIFEGRSMDAKKKLIQLIYKYVDLTVGIQPQDIEITIFETPPQNWGIRGKPGDELFLNYQVDV